MAKRRANGEGNIRRRENGRWEGRIVVGHKKNGTPIFRYFYAGTQKELLDKLHQSIHDHHGVELTEDSRMTLAQWLDRWLDEYMTASVRPSTLSAYRNYADCYIKPTLGVRQLAKITPTDIQKMYAELKDHGRVNEHPEHGRTLSDSTILHIHAMLHLAMETAVQARLIPQNPVERVAKPKADPKPRQILNDEQLDIFMETIQTDELWHDFFYTELTTGLRRGEICGLKWEDFDGDSGTLHIRRTVHKERGGILTTGEAKTETGMRKLLLPSSTAELLRKRKEGAADEWIFPDSLRPDRPVDPDAAYRRMKVLLKQAGLPSITFHALRHTFSTHALASGVDAKTLAGILGHTKASFTLDTYTHVTGDMQRRAASVVGDFMSEIFGEDFGSWQRNRNGETEASI